MENDGKKYGCWCCGGSTKSGSIGWGLFFIILGGYFILQEIGYISSNISAWAVAIVAFGIYLLVRGLR